MLVSLSIYLYQCTVVHLECSVLRKIFSQTSQLSYVGTFICIVAVAICCSSISSLVFTHFSMPLTSLLWCIFPVSFLASYLSTYPYHLTVLWFTVLTIGSAKTSEQARLLLILKYELSVLAFFLLMLLLWASESCIKGQLVMIYLLRRNKILHCQSEIFFTYTHYIQPYLPIHLYLWCLIPHGNFLMGDGHNRKVSRLLCSDTPP